MKDRRRSRIYKALVLLLALVLCTSLVSCKEDGETEDTQQITDTADSAAEPPAVPDTEKVLLHGSDPDNEVWAEAYLKALPARNFNGATFFITSSDTTMFDPDGVSYVSESVAKRNAALEEKYNILVMSAETDTATMLSEARESYMAGIYYTDIMAIPFDEVGTFAAEGVLTNLRSLPLFDADQPYFNSSSVKALTTGYTTYGVAGEATPASLDLPVVVFNKTLCSIFTDADLYTEALEGKFTWDRFFELMALADTSAEAGAVCETGAVAEYIFASVGESFVISGEKRVPAVAFESYSMDRAASCFRAILRNAAGAKVTPSMAASTFASGRALLSICSMRELDTYRTESVSMGILPMPKNSEEDSYRSLVGGDALILTVASGSTNSELTSLGLSGLCAASYGYITEEYVDYLHSTTLPDNRSADVLDLISKSAYYDLTTAFGSTVPGLTEYTRGLVADIMENGDFTNYELYRDRANSALSAAFPLGN